MRDIFYKRDYDQILSVPLSLGSETDSIYWARKENENYSVISAYRVVIGECSGMIIGWFIGLVCGV